jgi:hypothetical protein
VRTLPDISGYFQKSLSLTARKSPFDAGKSALLRKISYLEEIYEVASRFFQMPPLHPISIGCLLQKKTACYAADANRVQWRMSSLFF